MLDGVALNAWNTQLCVTIADNLAKSRLGHIPVLAQKPQSITQAQGDTRMAEPLPKLLCNKKNRYNDSNS